MKCFGEKNSHALRSRNFFEFKYYLVPHLDDNLVVLVRSVEIWLIGFPLIKNNYPKDLM